jgi:hypothetical protein
MQVITFNCAGWPREYDANVGLHAVPSGARRFDQTHKSQGRHNGSIKELEKKSLMAQFYNKII